MRRVYVDANVFLRFFTRDDEGQHERVRILEILDAVAAFPGLSLSDGATALSAISLARESGVEFADAYIAASAQSLGVDQIATFNAKDLKRLESALSPW